MGMSIDEIVQGIEVIKAQAEWDYPLDWQIVLDGAIETMRKYQKIQKIINNTYYIQEDVIRYKMICEVIKRWED